MGTVLAMNNLRMNRRRTRAGVLAVAALAALGACNSRNESSPVIGLVRAVVPAIGSVPGLAPEPATPAPGFATGDIAANPGAFRLVHMPLLGAPVLARRIADNPGSETFLAQNGFSASYADGILVATRGLGEDLLAADVRGLRAALAAGGGTTRRTHDMIGDLDQIVSETFDCVVATEGAEPVNLGIREVQATRLTETCRGPRTGFTNTYWIDGSGRIVSSLQFVSIVANYLRIAQL